MYEKQVVTKGISLYPDDWNALDKFAQSRGLNRSSALRFIIRLWAEREDGSQNDNGAHSTDDSGAYPDGS